MALIITNNTVKIEEMEPILTIAIPTFNHHELLKKQLVNLLPQIKDNTIIYVIDNCSYPPIKEYLEESGINLKSIKIIRNSSNIGGDANILKCFEIATTKWVWILSDNDIVNSTALCRIFESLNDEYCFINFGYKKSNVLMNYYEFCTKASYVNSFAISNCLYNKHKLANHIKYFKESIKTHQGQLIFLLKYFEDHENSKSLICNKTIFESLLSPQWPKLLFLIDAINLYNYLNPQKQLIIRHSNFGHQIISMHMILLSLSRAYEYLSISDTIKYFFIVARSASFKQKISIKYIKAIVYLIISIISPFLYRKIKSILLSKEFELSKGKRNKWE